MIDKEYTIVYTTSMKEIWKPIPKYKGWYSVSNFGRIRRDAGGQGAISNKIIKGCPNKKGYLTLSLHKNKRKVFSVASLVALTFIGKRPKGFTINHKDCNKFNNYPSNLEYITNLENMRHAWKNGLFKPKKGSDNGNSKLIKNIVLKIRKEYAKGNIFQRPLAKKYRVCQRTINMIVNRITWKHI